MPEEFEGSDLSDAVFWGSNLQRSLFRDSDLSRATFFHSDLSGVTIDAAINGLTINGVDVTDFVNANDRWFPLRNELSPIGEVAMRNTWLKLRDEWRKVEVAAKSLDESVVQQSVNGQWSLQDTLRHLIFVTDKWLAWPILGQRTFSAIGLPNTGSTDGDWPGRNPHALPTFATVVAARQQQYERVTAALTTLVLAELPAEVEVLENGMMPTAMCIHAVFEEEFEHLRYVLRDLASLGVVLS